MNEKMMKENELEMMVNDLRDKTTEFAADIRMLLAFYSELAKKFEQETGLERDNFLEDYSGYIDLFENLLPKLDKIP